MARVEWTSPRSLRVVLSVRNALMLALKARTSWSAGQINVGDFPDLDFDEVLLEIEDDFEHYLSPTRGPAIGHPGRMHHRHEAMIADVEQAIAGIATRYLGEIPEMVESVDATLLYRRGTRYETARVAFDRDRARIWLSLDDGNRELLCVEASAWTRVADLFIRALAAHQPSQPTRSNPPVAPTKPDERSLGHGRGAGIDDHQSEGT